EVFEARQEANDRRDGLAPLAEQGNAVGEGERPGADQLRQLGNHRDVGVEEVEDGADRGDELLEPAYDLADGAAEELAQIDANVVQAELVQGAAALQVVRPVHGQVGRHGGEVLVDARVAADARVQGQIDVHLRTQAGVEVQAQDIGQRHLPPCVLQVEEQVALEPGLNAAGPLGDAELQEEQFDLGGGVVLEVGGQADLQLGVLPGGAG